MESKNKRQMPGNIKSSLSDGTNRLLIDELKNILWSERTLEKIIRKMARNAGSPNLISILKDHDTLTPERVKRLEKVFESIGIRPRGKKSEAMEGLIGECENILEDTKQGPVRDAGMIASFQKILHYQIPAYSSLSAIWRKLGKEEVVEMLELTLAEDKKTNDLLSNAAYNTINFDAAIDENKFLASHYTKK